MTAGAFLFCAAPPGTSRGGALLRPFVRTDVLGDDRRRHGAFARPRLKTPRWQWRLASPVTRRVMWAEFAGRLELARSWPRRVPPGIEPDDVVQEVFLRVMRPIERK
jgi:hypothetical protein